MQPLKRCVSRRVYARTFQQLCRGYTVSDTTTSRVLSTSRSRPSESKEPDDDDTEVNFFEQEVVGGKHGGFKPLGGAKNLEARIRQLEQELDEMKSGRNLDWLPEQDREELRRSIREAQHTGEIEEDAAFDAKEFDELLGDMPSPEEGVKALLAADQADEDASPEVELKLPDVQEKSLKNLNQALREANAESASADKARQLWQTYRSSKRDVPGLIEQLPPAAWKILWQSQYDGGLSDDLRSKHLWILLDDMIYAGQALTPVQKVVRIEGHVAAGRMEKAMKWWEKSRSELQEIEEVSGAFLSLGPRIKAMLGQVEQAEKLALEISRNYNGGATLFLPVIETLLRRNDSQSTNKAAGLYVKLRCSLGQNIALEDFDRLAMAFLTNGQPEIALGVFKDLLSFSRKTSDSQADSTAAYKTSMRLYNDIQAQSAGSTSELNAMAMKTLTFLPPSFQNKFFYASWLKRLIGLDALDAATQVLELMYRRGVRPDPIHLNGLMSAWLRSGRTTERDIALRLGHAMIQARISFVAAREASAAGQPLPPSAADPSAQLPPYLGKALPAATVETFAILLSHYTRHNMPSSIEALQQALHSANLEPNAFFITHLLRFHLRAEDPASAWKLFTTASRNDTRADLSTFAALWDNCRKHVSLFNPGRSQVFPGPRALFSRMISWFGQLKGRERTSALDSFSPQLYTQILRCFFTVRDLRGTLVAMYALRDTFGVYPDADAARCVLELVASVGEAPQSRSQRVYVPGIGRARIRGEKGQYLRRRRGVKMLKDPVLDERMERVAKLLQQVREARRDDLMRNGVDMDELPAECVGEENLWALGAFLRTAIRERAAALARAKSAAAEEEVELDGEGGGSNADGTDPLSERETSISAADERLEQVAFGMGAGGMQAGAPVYERGADGEWLVKGWEERGLGE